MGKRGRKPSVYTPEVQQKFLGQLNSETFTFDDAKEFVVTNFRLDYVKAIKQFEQRATASFLSSFKEDDGTRSILSTADDSKKYVVVGKTEDIGLLEAVCKQLEMKKNGYDKNIKKIVDMIYKLKYQLSIFRDKHPKAQEV